MIRRPPRSTRTDTLFPYTTLFRSLSAGAGRDYRRRREPAHSQLDHLWPGRDSLSSIRVARNECRAREGQAQRDAGFRCGVVRRSEEHTSELLSLMRISYAVFCLKKTIKSMKHMKSTTTKNLN